MVVPAVDKNVRHIDPQLRDLLRRAMQGELERPSPAGFISSGAGFGAGAEASLFLLPLLPFWAWWNFHSYQGLGVTTIEKVVDQYRLTEKTGRETTLDRKRFTLRVVELGDGRRMLVLIARRPGTWLQHLRVPLTLLGSEDGKAVLEWTDFLGVRPPTGTLRAKNAFW